MHPRLRSFSDPEIDHAQPPGDVRPICKGVPEHPEITRPAMPDGFRELIPGEETRPDDLIWLAGNGPFEPLGSEYNGPMYAYKPQPSPSECGHFMHIRRIGSDEHRELEQLREENAALRARYEPPPVLFSQEATGPMFQPNTFP